MLIVSLTSIPNRLDGIGPALDSLLAQTRQPDQVRLHLGPLCRPFAWPGVEVRRCHDYGPLTKILPAIDYTLSPDDLIVTADDDQRYEPTWLETLWRHAEMVPGAVGLSGWNVARLLAGGSYEFVRAPGPADVLEGFAGVAYRRGFFGVDILAAPAEFRTVDDVWISSYLARRRVDRAVVGQPMSHDYRRGAGLHTAPGFIEQNREAARQAFAVR